MLFAKVTILLLSWMICRVRATDNDYKIRLAGDFASSKKLTLISAIVCWKHKEKIALAKSINKTSSQLAIYDLNTHVLKSEIVLKMDYYKIGVILDTRCQNITGFLKECALNDMFNQSYFWLMFDSEQTVAPILKNISMGVNADITLARQVNNTHKFSIYDVYNPGFDHGGILNMTKIGFWTPAAGFQINSIQSKYVNRWDFRGIALKIGIVVTRNINIPFEEYISREDKINYDTQSRYLYSVLKYFPQKFNYTTTVKRTNSWGFVRNGKMDGIVSMLGKKEIDYSSTPIQIRIERYSYIACITSVWTLDCAFIFRHPKRLDTNRNLFFRPLTDSCWGSTFTEIVLIIILMKIILLAEKRFVVDRSLHSDTTSIESSWNNLIVFSISAVAQQGTPQIPIVLSGRLLTIVLLIFTTILFQFYSASIVGSLLMESPKTITTIKALYESDLQAGSEDISYIHDWFENARDPNYVGLYEKKIKATDTRPAQYYPPEEGLRKASVEGFAYHIEKSTAYKIIQDTWSERAICDVTNIPFQEPVKTMFAVSKRSPFKEMFAHLMLIIKERGLMDHQLKRWTVGKPQCNLDAAGKLTSVDMAELSSAFLLLVCGVAVSFVLLLAEKFVHSQQRNIFKKVYSK